MYRRRTRSAEDWMYLIGDRLVAVIAGVFALFAFIASVVNGAFFFGRDDDDHP